MTTLDVRELSVEVGGKTVVSDLSFTLRAGDKMGVVGRNGAGKTSLLKVLGGEAPAAARHRHPNGCDRLPAAGPAPAPGRRSRHRRRSTSSRRGTWSTWPPAREGPDPARGDRTATRTSRGSPGSKRSTGTPAATRPSPRRERITAGLGLAKDRLALPVRALSGGERRRLELARILFGGSDLLLLDEPTNHLDADAKRWLMKFLASLPRRAASWSATT